ncbi:MAG TPA: adenosylcobinamide amidohydrolase [Steroidobacteraceae bacterium]|jgi:adenosylcobinamide amidohydrolase|nr:adenosylcobinamide amidohydrolase [Steroidobacteraceae bacterium]
MSTLQHAAPELSACGRWLEIDPGVPHSTLGWTLIGGGRRQAQRVFWHNVRDGDLSPELDAKRFFEERRKQRAGDTRGVGFLTGCTLAEYVDQRRNLGNLFARCVATVGLNNALRIGDRPGTTAFSPGTINILLQVSRPLSACASLEALSLVAEARTLAMLESHVPSTWEKRPRRALERIASSWPRLCPQTTLPRRSTRGSTRISVT